MFSDCLQKYADDAWLAAKDGLQNILSSLEENLSGLSGDEFTLLQLLYGTLPASDVASVPFSTLMGYIRHSLFLRENSPFCRDLPEDSFIHYVFYPRINSEDLCNCRRFFYDLLIDRIQGLSEEEAVLEVNRWCAENMTYEMSDDRSENPMTAYYSGLGRCGEESTFAVTAFRSVGIPARQVYVPYWVHCDDNHAWVEVYANGRWHFLGACEPEPVLDLGWFNDASGRAPLAVCRSFVDFIGEGLADEKLLEKRGCSSLYNVTSHYVITTNLTIQVLSSEGQPLPEADIRLEVVNMAAYRPVFCGVTDEQGCLSISLGRTDYHLEARHWSDLAVAEIHVDGNEQFISVTMGTFAASSNPDYQPAPVSSKNRITLNPEQKARKAATLLACQEKRLSRIASYYLPEYDQMDPEWQEILHLAGGNAKDLYLAHRLLPDERQRDLLKKLLKVMAVKDYKDVKISHLLSSLRAESPEIAMTRFLEFSPDHFVKEVINPRIRYEFLENWRPAISKAFTTEEKIRFIEDPQLFMQTIEENYPDGSLRYYPVLSMQPSSTLKLGHSDEKGRRLLFVAGMRTFGVPARINPVDDKAEYWRAGAYHAVSKDTSVPSSAVLRLLFSLGTTFTYGVNFGLAVQKEDHYQPLDFSGLMPSQETDGEAFGMFELPLSEGHYRLLTTNRLPNGKQLCHVEEFDLEPGQTLTLSLFLRSAAPEEMLSHNQLDAAALPYVTGPSCLLWLDPGTEPSEHVLNELLAVSPRILSMQKAGVSFAFLFKNASALAHPTVQKVLETIPKIEVRIGDDGTDVMAARKMFLEPGIYPLLLLTDHTCTGYFASCGYQVGAVDLLLKLCQTHFS